MASQRAWGKIGVMVLAFFGCGILAAFPQVTSEASARAASLYAEAVEAQRRGDYASAAVAYQKLVALHPEDVEARVNLGLVHHLAGQLPEAIRVLEVAVRAKPQIYPANLILGMDLLRTGRPREACRYLEKAHRLKSDAVEPVLTLAQARSELGDFAAANRWYRRATELDVHNADAWYGLGTTYLSLTREAAQQLRRVGEGSYSAELLVAESLADRGAYRDAAELYRKLLRQYPQREGLHTGLGFCLALQADPALLTSATEEFQAELREHPGCLPARLGLGRVALQQSRLEDAFDSLRAVWKIDSTFASAHLSRVWSGLPPEQLGSFNRWLDGKAEDRQDSAAAAFLVRVLETWARAPISAAVGLSEDTSGPAVGSAAELPSVQGSPQMLHAAGRYSKCAAVLRPRLKQLPPADLELLAECAYLQGDYRAVFQVGQRQVQVRPSNVSGLFWQARAAPKLAMMALAKAGELQPHSPQMHFLLGQSCLEGGRYDDAAVEYMKALELQPDFLPARVGLATAYVGAGQHEQALAELRVAEQQNPDDPDMAALTAEILIFKRQYAEAMPYLDKAARGSRADMPRIHALRSRILLADGKADAALAELRQALSADTDGSYHFQLAQIYRRLGDPQTATAALQESERIRNANRDKRRPVPLGDSAAPGLPPPNREMGRTQ